MALPFSRTPSAYAFNQNATPRCKLSRTQQRSTLFHIVLASQNSQTTSALSLQHGVLPVANDAIHGALFGVAFLGSHRHKCTDGGSWRDIVSSVCFFSAASQAFPPF